jgi:rare lipoprotein A
MAFRAPGQRTPRGDRRRRPRVPATWRSPAGFSPCSWRCGSGRACGPAPAPPKAAGAAPAQTGVAAYYGREFAGRETASGEPHDPQALVAASRTLPLGPTAKVTNTETGRTVAVEVNDRGPYSENRILDVSPKAAERLGMKDEGVAKVEVQPLRAHSLPSPSPQE